MIDRMTPSSPTPPVTWVPAAPEHTEMYRFAVWIAEQRGVDLGVPGGTSPARDPGGDETEQLFRRLHAWSVTETSAFWDAVREYFGVLGSGFDTAALTKSTMPGAIWYPNAQLNFAENVLERTRDLVEDDDVALLTIEEDNSTAPLTWAQLRSRIHGLARHLRELGVQPGDRVAAVLPNIAEAVIGLLATAAIGAVWTINSPDLTPTATLARLRQLNPTVLITTAGYTFNGRWFDLTDHRTELVAGLPDLTHHIDISEFPEAPNDHAGSEDAHYLRVPFDHPLWVLFSSGSTGDPKGIVHSHGGMLLESLKGQSLHQDMQPHDRYYVSANTSWMVWNTLVQALACGTSVVVYPGSPQMGDADRQFEIIARTAATRFAVGAPYLSLVERSGLVPSERWDLTRLKSILSTAAPLPNSTWLWVHEHVNASVRLGSDTGGTDICSGFLGTNPLEPIRLGELQGPMLGVDARSFNDNGDDAINDVGELVITKPMPSMPLYLWHDDDGARYRATYFDRFTDTQGDRGHGVWAQGDWVVQTERGSFVVHGRSDATLNRQGVRLGTAEIYAALASIDEVTDATVIGVEHSQGAGYWMPLFIQLTDGAELTDQLHQRIIAQIRAQTSPRHVPNEIIEVAGIPVTHAGKRIEVPLKKLFSGRPIDQAINRDALANPETVGEFASLAELFQSRL